MTLGTFYGLIEQVVKLEKWKRGEVEDPNKPLSPEEWVEAAKRGEIIPTSPGPKKGKAKADPMTLRDQKEFLKKLGIPTGR